MQTHLQRKLAAMSVCLAVASHLHADQPAAVPGPAFEVASIKPNNSGSGSDTINT